MREKLLSQFEAWFRFVLDAQEGHSGEQEDELQRLVEGWRHKDEEDKRRQQGRDSIEIQIGPVFHICAKFTPMSPILTAYVHQNPCHPQM